MQLANYENGVSSLTVITTCLQYFSGFLVCKQYVVNQTTAETTALPFISGFICCSLWFVYGLLKPDYFVMVVNLIGVTLMICYSAIFLIYTKIKSILKAQVALAVTFVIFAALYTHIHDVFEEYFSVLGYTACIFTLLTIASPMIKLSYVIRVKSTECLSFLMILMTFFVSVSWLLYGVENKDDFLIIANFVGAALSVLQLPLFVVYPNKTQSPSSKKEKSKVKKEKCLQLI